VHATDAAAHAATLVANGRPLLVGQMRLSATWRITGTRPVTDDERAQALANAVHNMPGILPSVLAVYNGYLATVEGRTALQVAGAEAWVHAFDTGATAGTVLHCPNDFLVAHVAAFQRLAAGYRAYYAAHQPLAPAPATVPDFCTYYDAAVAGCSAADIHSQDFKENMILVPVHLDVKAILAAVIALGVVLQVVFDGHGIVMSSLLPFDLNDATLGPEVYAYFTDLVRGLAAPEGISESAWQAMQVGAVTVIVAYIGECAERQKRRRENRQDPSTGARLVRDMYTVAKGLHVPAQPHGRVVATAAILRMVLHVIVAYSVNHPVSYVHLDSERLVRLMVEAVFTRFVVLNALLYSSNCIDSRTTVLISVRGSSFISDAVWFCVSQAGGLDNWGAWMKVWFTLSSFFFGEHPLYLSFLGLAAMQMNPRDTVHNVHDLAGQLPLFVLAGIYFSVMKQGTLNFLFRRWVSCDLHGCCAQGRPVNLAILKSVGSNNWLWHCMACKQRSFLSARERAAVERGIADLCVPDWRERVKTPFERQLSLGLILALPKPISARSKDLSTLTLFNNSEVTKRGALFWVVLRKGDGAATDISREDAGKCQSVPRQNYHMHCGTLVRIKAFIHEVTSRTILGWCSSGCSLGRKNINVVSIQKIHFLQQGTAIVLDTSVALVQPIQVLALVHGSARFNELNALSDGEVSRQLEDAYVAFNAAMMDRAPHNELQLLRARWEQEDAVAGIPRGAAPLPAAGAAAGIRGEPPAQRPRAPPSEPVLDRLTLAFTDLFLHDDMAALEFESVARAPLADSSAEMSDSRCALAFFCSASVFLFTCTPFARLIFLLACYV
jgi:hypothetical protein